MKELAHEATQDPWRGLATGALALALAACGGNGGTAEGSASTSGDAAGTTYKIGVLQLTEHAALDAANEGFVAALDDSGISYEIDQQNAQNDQPTCQTIASKLVNDGDDLILAIGTRPRRRSRAPRPTSPSSAPPSPTSPSRVSWPTTTPPAAT